MFLLQSCPKLGGKSRDLVCPLVQCMAERLSSLQEPAGLWLSGVALIAGGKDTSISTFSLLQTQGTKPAERERGGDWSWTVMGQPLVNTTCSQVLHVCASAVPIFPLPGGHRGQPQVTRNVAPSSLTQRQTNKTFSSCTNGPGCFVVFVSLRISFAAHCPQSRVQGSEMLFRCQWVLRKHGGERSPA
jgi:hypothetical protein